MLNSRTATSGTSNTTLKKQNNWAKPRREAADGLHGGKLRVPATFLVRNGSAFGGEAFGLPPLGQALLEPFLQEGNV